MNLEVREKRAIVICALIVLAGLGIMIPRWIRDAGRVDSVQVMAQQAAEVFAQFDIISLDDRDRIVQLLREAPVVAGADLRTPTAERALIELVIGFLDTYTDSHPDRYIEWRSGLGATLVGEAQNELRQRAYQYYKQQSMPDGLTAEQEFRVLWEMHRTLFKGGNELVGIAGEQRGYFWRHRILRPNDMAPPRLPDIELWVGGTNAMSGNLFEAHPSMETILDRDGAVHAAYLTSLVACADGSRRPWTWMFFFDPQRAKWNFGFIMQTNSPAPEAVAPWI